MIRAALLFRSALAAGLLLYPGEVCLLPFGTCSGAWLYCCAVQVLLAWTRQTCGVARLRRAAWAVQPATTCTPCSAAAPQSCHVMAAAPLTWHRATTQRMRWAVGATARLCRAQSHWVVIVMRSCSAWTALVRGLLHWASFVRLDPAAPAATTPFNRVQQQFMPLLLRAFVDSAAAGGPLPIVQVPIRSVIHPGASCPPCALDVLSSPQCACHRSHALPQHQAGVPHRLRHAHQVPATHYCNCWSCLVLLATLTHACL
jgi:hypothetical protein